MSETSEATPLNLLQKLASIVAEIDHVEKSGRNTFQNYNYVKAADVAWLVRKALSSRNIYLVSDVVEVRNYTIPAKENTVMQAVDVRMEFSFFDGDSPATLPIVTHAWGTGTDKGDKAIYKAMTGALKYGLRHSFIIPDESDPEADVETDKATAAAKATGEAKVAELKKKAGKSPAEATERPSKAVPCLFYTEPPAQNGFFVEFVNIREFLSTREDMQDGVTEAMRGARAKKTKSETALVPTGELQPLLEKLVGEMGLTVKKLEAPANA